VNETMFKRVFQTCRQILLCGAIAFAAGKAMAETVVVKPTLSGETVTVGDSIEYRVELAGFGGSISAPELAIDGLRTQGPQVSSRIQIGSSFDSSTTLIYTLEPERAGTYTVPALRFRSGNKTIETQAVSFKAEDAKPGIKGAAPASGPRVWAEIALPKKTAYVGEVLPIEIRFFIDATIRCQLESLPSLDGEGLTKAKLSNPKTVQVERDGHTYVEAIIRTTITPIKAGTVRIGPSEIQYLAQIPRARPNRSRSPLDDFFGDTFFNDPAFARTEQRKTTAEAAELTVKPLPVQGRPANFSGAVGEFALSGEGSPNRLKVGDPITMKLKVSGSGNFDRVSAPVLANTKGWRTYPPSANFKPDDEAASHGTKTFEVAVIPETKKTQMPVFEFSYFDPVRERYVTANSGTLPLPVEGEAPANPPPVERAEHLGSATPPPAAAPPQPQVNDIHGINYEFGRERTFEPLYLRSGFWLAQLAPLLLLAGGALLKLRKPKADAARLEALRRERGVQFAKLRREHDPEAFYDAAARVLQLETALRSGQVPDLIDEEAVAAVLKPDEETATLIERIFHSRAEALYAGGGGGRSEITEADRRRVVEALEHAGGGK